MKKNHSLSMILVLAMNLSSFSLFADDTKSITTGLTDSLSETKSIVDKKIETAPIKNLKNSIININTASKEELAKLPGIGEKKALTIIAARPFNAPEDLLKVKGIKENIYNKIKNNITTH